MPPLTFLVFKIFVVITISLNLDWEARVKAIIRFFHFLSLLSSDCCGAVCGLDICSSFIHIVSVAFRTTVQSIRLLQDVFLNSALSDIRIRTLLLRIHIYPSDLCFSIIPPLIRPYCIPQASLLLVPLRS